MHTVALPAPRGSFKQLRRGGLVTSAAAILGASLLALLFGLVAATGSPVFVAVSASLIVGVALMLRLDWTLWLILVLGLLVAGLVPIWAEGLATKAVWGISILGFLLMVAALFRAATTPELRIDTPGFIWVFLVFVVYSVLVTVLHLPSPWEAIGGIKRYFQALGVMFALTWLTIDPRTIALGRRLFVVAAVLQLPFAAYELIKLVPYRESIRSAYPTMIPIDVVAGTFGSQLHAGGANAEMATFLIVVLSFLIARLRNGVLGRRRFLVLLPFILAPLFMGETKIVIVLLPIMMGVLYRREILARPHVALAGLAIALLLTLAAVLAYAKVFDKTPEQMFQDTVDYNFGDRGYGRAYLNRTTVLTFWAEEQGWEDPVGAVLGNGIGASHDISGGHVANRYPGYRISLTAASVMLWDTGVLGVSIFLFALYLAWRTAGRLLRRAASPVARADAAAIQCSILIFAVYIFYRIALLETLSFQIVFASLLGYLAWIHKQEARRPVTK